MKRLWIIPLLLLMAVAPEAHAESVPAGFPQSSVWLSKTNLITGDGATIYTVVYNSSGSSLQGTVVFLVDGKPVGSKPWSAAPGTTEIISQTWAATEGEHSITAKIEGLTGSSVPLTTLQTSTTTVSVLPPPAPSELVTDTQVAVDTIAGTLGDTAPIVADIASTTSNIAEDIRGSVVDALTSLASSTAPKGEVLGAEDYQAQEGAPAKENLVDQIASGAQKLLHAVVSALLIVASSPLWFYLALLILLIVLIQFARMVGRERKFNRR
ncbi:MAG: hypothetical protein KBC16_01500 [Candidatus Pacebacteria bacterium]|nr:hypothetical protein [Candidatus Paceibacterota bacterium]